MFNTLQWHILNPLKGVPMLLLASSPVNRDLKDNSVLFLEFGTPQSEVESDYDICKRRQSICTLF